MEKATKQRAQGNFRLTASKKLNLSSGNDAASGHISWEACPSQSSFR
jgi:hypothetical protein